MKRRLSLLLACLMVLSLFAGCAKTQTPAEDPAPAASSQTPDAPTPSAEPAEQKTGYAFPLSEEKVTLGITLFPESYVDSYEVNEFTQWYEEKTNVHIEWDILPTVETATKVNLLLSSGILPEVLMGCDIDASTVNIYGGQGMFLPLNDYIEQYGTHFKNVLEKSPYVKDMITMPDGNIYSLPRVNETFHVTMDNKAWMYMPWLEKVGKELPTTTDELYEVLKAFKEEDPNGNGKADEIPMAGWADTQGSPCRIEYFLMNAFITTDKKQTLHYLTLKDGVIGAGFTTDEWREGLRYVKKLYDEKLLAPETFTQDSTQLKQMGENPEIPILGSAITGYYGQFIQTYSESGRWLDYKTIPALEGPNGQRTTSYYPYGGAKMSEFIITNSCKNPEIAFQWADYLYSEEGTMGCFYGLEGSGWEKAKEGDVGLDGNPAKWVDLNDYGVKHSKNWGNIGPKYASLELTTSRKADPEKPLEMFLYEESKKNYEPYLQDMDTVIPPLVFDEERATELVDIATSLNRYVEEMTVSFITGKSDLDSDWDSYKETCAARGLETALKIYQEAYDTLKK